MGAWTGGREGRREDNACVLEREGGREGGMEGGRGRRGILCQVLEIVSTFLSRIGNKDLEKKSLTGIVRLLLFHVVNEANFLLP